MGGTRRVAACPSGGVRNQDPRLKRRKKDESQLERRPIFFFFLFSLANNLSRSGDDYIAVMNHARANGYAIPAVNCTMSPIINACLEAAKKANAPMIIQFSNGGGAYMAGKGLKNESDQKAAVMGCVAGALHVRALAEFYGVPIILHTDHCSKALLPWFDGLLEANEEVRDGAFPNPASLFTTPS